MSMFIPSKLTVNFMAPVTEFRPLEGRKYTLTHSDETGQLYLNVGKFFDYSAINPKIRDEVLVEWIPRMGEFILIGNVYISGGEYEEKYAKVRYLIFKKELELALKAIIYGDKGLFLYFPWLLDAPIYIHFESVYPEFNQTLYFGTPRYYLNAINEESYQKHG